MLNVFFPACLILGWRQSQEINMSLLSLLIYQEGEKMGREKKREKNYLGSVGILCDGLTSLIVSSQSSEASIALTSSSPFA